MLAEKEHRPRACQYGSGGVLVGMAVPHNLISKSPSAQFLDERLKQGTPINILIPHELVVDQEVNALSRGGSWHPCIRVNSYWPLCDSGPVPPFEHLSHPGTVNDHFRYR